MKSKLLICAIGLTFSGLAGATTLDKPNLSATYQASFQGAWNKTAAGELPVYECTQIVGTATRMLSEPTTAVEAKHAYKACYVDAILNYSEAFFKLNDHASIEKDGMPYGCSLYSRYLKGHVVSLETYAERFGFSATQLNHEINTRLQEPASLCQVALN